MNLENLEDLWGAQRPMAAAQPLPGELNRLLAPELRRRSRIYGYEFFCIGLALVLTPLLAVVNYRYQRPEYPVLYWFNAALFVIVALVALTGLIRGMRRHRQLAQTQGDSMAAFAAKALATVEAEMRDYRRAFVWFLIWFGLAVLAIYVNHPVTTHGWAPLGRRVIGVLIFYAVLGAVYVRHYYKNLRPERARRRQLLRELS